MGTNGTIKNVKIEYISESPLNPFQLRFTQNATRRTWDLINAQDTVHIIIYNIEKDTLILVKKFEPAVYAISIPKEKQTLAVDMNEYPEDLGMVLELCGNTLMNNQEEVILDIAMETVLHETGYKVPRDSLQFISSYKSDVGPKCGEDTVFFCEVDNEMKVAEGGKIGEKIVEMKVEEIRKYVRKSFPEMKSSSSFLYAMLWFLNEKYKRN